MAVAVKPLTLEEFRLRSGGRKPYFEYWFGEAIQKPASTSLHGILQQMICALLKAAGYRVGSGIELRIDREWQPKPDVLASSHPLGQPYPTKPVDLVVEILFDDRMQMVIEKCRNYSRIGIGRVFVVFARDYFQTRLHVSELNSRSSPQSRDFALELSTMNRVQSSIRGSQRFARKFKLTSLA